MPNTASRKIGITEAARLLDRSPHTLRSWDRNDAMPARLRPKRDANGHRYWTQELIDEIKEWIKDNHFHPGRGIDYHPSPEQLRRHVDKIRAAAHARSNEFSDEAEMLRSIARDALNNRGLTPDQLVENLPQVHDQLIAGGYVMTLADATRIVSEVIQEHGE